MGMKRITQKEGIEIYRSPQKIHHVKIVFTIGGLVGLMILLTVFIYSKSNSLATNAVVLEINQEPITYKEYKRYLDENRSAVYAYFNGKYDLTSSSQFWNTSFEGEVPLEHLKQVALDQLVSVKVQLGILKEEGMIEDLSFSSFEKRWKTENQRREKALSKGKVIYGPVQYSESEFFHYEFSNLVLELTHKLAEKEDTFSKVQLRDYYESIKEGLYKKADTIEIVKLAASSFEGKLSEQTQDTLLAYQSKLDQGVGIDSLIQDAQQIGFDVTEQTLDENSQRDDIKFSNEVYMNAGNLQVGQYSDIFEIDGELAFVYCKARKTNGYESYEYVADQIKLEYIRMVYEADVEKQAEQAIIITKDAYYNIPMK